MTMTSTRPTLAVGMVGYAFMGAAHSQAWRTAPRFFDLPLTPTMQVVCGRDAERTAEAADRLGWAETETDWRRLVERQDIDLVDICTPGDTHAEIAIAALAAGKHVLCEKPLANTVAEAEAMTAAAEQAARARRARDGRLHLPTGPGDRAGPPARRRGPDRRGPARAGAVPPGLDRRPRGAALVAAGQEQGGLRRAGRHRRPHRRPDPAHHRRTDHRGVRPARDVREGAPDRDRARRPARRRRGEARPGHRRRRRGRSSPGSPAAGSASSRPPASPPAARTRSASRSTARRAAWPSTSRT